MTDETRCILKRAAKNMTQALVTGDAELAERVAETFEKYEYWDVAQRLRNFVARVREQNNPEPREAGAK